MTQAVALWEDKVDAYRAARFENQVRVVVGLLPPVELAAMAEALVSLTSFKRRVSAEPETVGGPTDVAVITRAK